MAKLNRGDAFSSILGSSKVSGRSGDRQLALDEIRLNPDQPRKFFDEAALEALTASIREKGVLQPVLVRERGDAYELVAGERRYRAAQRAGLETIPVIIRELSDEETLEIALIENLQREDLNPVEETDGTLRLLSLKLGISVQDALEAIRQSHYRALGRADNTGVINPNVEAVEALFKSIGRLTPSSFYSHRVPLLKLPADLLEAVRSGRLEYSKARLLTGIKDEERRATLLLRAVEETLSREQIKKAVDALREHRKGDPGAVNLGSIKRKLTPERIERLTATKQQELDKLLARIDALLES